MKKTVFGENFAPHDLCFHQMPFASQVGAGVGLPSAVAVRMGGEVGRVHGCFVRRDPSRIFGSFQQRSLKDTHFFGGIQS